MIGTLTPEARSAGRRSGNNPAFYGAMLAGLIAASATAHGQPTRQFGFEVLPSGFGSTAIPNLIASPGRGLAPWLIRGDYSPAPAAGSGKLDLLLTQLRGGEISTILTQFDTARSEDSLRFGMTGVLPDQRLVLRGSLQAGRQHNALGTQVLPGRRYWVFGDIGLAFQMRRDLSFGAEYRLEPDNSKPAGPFGSRAREGAWKDVFISWSPSSSVVLTAAHVDLGELARVPGSRKQTGQYLSAQFRY